MKTASIYQTLEYQDTKPVVIELFETGFTKEMRIAMKKGQTMQEFRLPYPFVIEIVDGALDFMINGDVIELRKGALLSLDEDISYDFIAIAHSIIRLSIYKVQNSNKIKRRNLIGLRF
jgi:quercetin dioxygenase-like cupin family protein